VIARALWTVSNLMLNNRVTVAQEISDEPGTGLFFEIVRIDVFGYPTERDELLSALGAPAGREWTGDTGARYREWRGQILTMDVCVQEMVGLGPDAFGPAASAPAADAEPMTCLGAPGGFVGDCGQPGPHGPHPLDEQPSTTGRLVSDGPEPWALRYDLDGPPVLRPAVPVVGVAPATDGRDAVAESYARYARALFVFQHEEERFTSGAAVLRAIEVWDGRHMLTDADAGHLAAELGEPVDEPAEVEPDIRDEPEVQQGLADIGPRPYTEQTRGTWLFRRRVGRRGGHRAGAIGTI
jgi:hypothetical protein